MNWKQLNEAYPQAFLEWVNKSGNGKVIAVKYIEGDFYADYQYALSVISIAWLNGRFLQLPEYFDALGIHVGPDYYKGGYVCPISIGDEFSAFLRDFPTRREALEAGVIKAFEIREEQLKQKEK